MKFNKLVAKGLSIGLLLNSMSILSYANTEIPNRYQNLEGEYITIDDSTEGNLEEIEIFGNTIQDPNNLEGIQSVGDLYVDKNGNPILDSQGRKQYKINLISQNSIEITLDKFSYRKSGNWIINGQKCIINNKTANMYYEIFFNHNNVLSSNEKYTMFVKVINNTLQTTIEDRVAFSIIPYSSDSSVNHSYNIHNIPSEIVIPFSTAYDAYTNPDRIGSIFVDYWVTGDIELELYLTKGTFSSFDEYKKYKKEKNIELLLPSQLQKVGDVADRLYWDNIKKRYVIEKNIKELTLTGKEKWQGGYMADINTSRFAFYKDDATIHNVISNRFSVNNWSNGVFIHPQGIIYVTLPSTQMSVGEFKNYLDLSPIKILYQINESFIIDTNITSKLKIPTYNEKTHIYVDSENGINPTLKVTVDRLPQIAKEAVAQAEIHNTNHNIALARRYINMLPESSYKDQLQNQLNEIFSSDMVLDMKTATSNLDIYIKCENILQMSLDTNQISFDDFSGIEDVVKENAVNISINSSLPYQLNAYLPSEIQNSDKSVAMDKSILNIKENSQSNYQTFTNTTDKIILKDNCSAGNYLTHGVDLKLAGGIAHEKDVYKATIKLEAEQK